MGAFRFLAVLVVMMMCTWIETKAQCPWARNLTDLHSSCICSFGASRLSLQCTAVDVTKLVKTLKEIRPASPAIELFYVKNSTLQSIEDNLFQGLRINSIHLTRCGINSISPNALSGLESTLKSVSLPENGLESVPGEALKTMRILNTLDLSNNRLSIIANASFDGLRLDTLNLMGNNLSLDQEAFAGLERSLKNLNLKDTGLTELPLALQRLRGLAFLDLAINSISNVSKGYFANMGLLTALSMERNPLQELDPDAFQGLQKTLSSLSLLNNLFTEVPTLAIQSLTSLRVLDLGFNQIENISTDAFQSVSSLTLLALDGNPLRTLPAEAFQHLNKTLRGLSVGGKSLICDCRIRWITEWVRQYDLQVTSREKNPQFCGQPRSLRSRNLYQIRPNELVCEEPITVPTTSIATTTTTTAATTTTTPATTVTVPTMTTASSTATTTTMDMSFNNATTSTTTATSAWKIAPTPSQTYSIRGTPRKTPGNDDNTDDDTELSPGERRGRTELQDPDIRVTEAYRKDSTVVIEWDALTNNILGFRVVYRPFGDTKFELGPPLSNTKQEFRIRNVPQHEFLIVCVINLEITNVTAESVPAGNCREVRGSANGASHTEVDKIIIIAACAAICVAIIIVVIVVVCCHRQCRAKRNGSVMAAPMPPPPMVTIPAMDSPIKADWDNASAYSTRSIPRARMYHMNGGRPVGTVNSAYLHDDARSHLSQGTMRPMAIDTQSHHSYSMSNGGGGNGINHYPLGRADLNRSSKSLAQIPYSTNTNGNGKRNRPSKAGSVHSLTGYDTETGSYFHPQPHWPESVDIYATGDRKTRAFGKRDFT